MFKSLSTLDKKPENQKTLPAAGWRNKKGTSERDCNCGTWKKHWIKHSGETWPEQCSVVGCTSNPTLGAHIRNPKVEGEKIAPFCDSCNKEAGEITLKGGITLVSANKKDTCD